GLKFALVIRSGKVMADGNWIFAGVVDERADEEQRQALAAIVGGQAGGPPTFIRENLVSDFRGVEFKPIEFTLDGLRRSAVIPDVLSLRSRVWPRATAAASRSTSTTRPILQAAVSPWLVPKSCTCTASGSASISW